MAKNKKDIPLWAQSGHKKPVSRRDFLSAGIIPFAAHMFVPNWMSLVLGSSAQAATAADCPIPNSLIPFVTVNLSGGAAMAANYVPMNSARQPISTYNKLGLGNNQVPIERAFGNAPFAGNGISKFLTGLKTQANAATIAKTAFVAFCVDSQNDTNANKFDVSGAITKAGLVGSNLPNMGNRNTRTGMNQSAGFAPPPAPLVVGNYNSLLTSIGYSSTLGSALNASQKGSLVKLMSNLTESQTRKIASIQGGETVKTVLDCAGIKNMDVIARGNSAVDPRSSSAVAGVWGINANTANNNRELLFGAMVYNTLLGQAGASNLEIGGYDYHNNTRTAGDAKDLDAGNEVGRILQTASVLGKPVMVLVVSDGSVYSDPSEDRAAPWVGDRGHGVAYLFYFDPAGRPATSDFQVGHFNNNQASDPSFVTGSNPELVAAAVFANWCQANKRMDLFDRVGGRILDSNQLSQVIKVA
ncbi:hypothetical protein ACLVWU_07115 [Bdellovibrio sp. HCB290]|uniref:hypothetical protein n=1 Tax=Bdellovibrio sp. HCB290 TaxID=3394356 RepID=UPI0039B66748